MRSLGAAEKVTTLFRARQPTPWELNLPDHALKQTSRSENAPATRGLQTRCRSVYRIAAPMGLSLSEKYLIPWTAYYTIPVTPVNRATYGLRTPRRPLRGSLRVRLVV
jgi:hypothetical protein